MADHPCRWALGVCLYAFVFGALPFQGAGMLNIHAAIRLEPLNIPAVPVISRNLEDLLRQLMDKDQFTRPKLKVCCDDESYMLMSTRCSGWMDWMDGDARGDWACGCGVEALICL